MVNEPSFDRNHRSTGLANISIGSEIRVSYNVYATDARLLVYPTLGVRYLF
jgi:hypothetical protein